jgi:DMSO/TMAO reductase YedYZ molybdopterin-dependent catalytic subunit
VRDRTIGRAAFLGVVGAGLAGLWIGRDVTGLVGRIVPDGLEQIAPTSGWRIYTIGARMPAIAPTDYRLRIEGLVERPLTYTLADLGRLPPAAQVSDFHCVTGWSVHGVRWEGVRIQELLAEAGLADGAQWLRFVSDEVPYDDTLSLQQAFLPDVMLATRMDGAPLSRPHGGPARLVVPRMYGYKSVKWVTRIEVVADEIPGYWEQRGYDSDAWVGDSNGYSS